MKMKRFLNFLRRRKLQRNDSRTSLIKENNNNNVQVEHEEVVNGYHTPLIQNTFNTHKEQHLQRKEDIPFQELAELLNLVLDATKVTCEDGGSWPNSGQHNLNRTAVSLIQQSVSKHFPKPPTPPDQNLNQHLLRVQEAVLHELVRLSPLLESAGLMGCLVDHYHRQIFDHLDSLLQNVTSTQNCFVLMNWVQHTYRSEELLSHPGLQDVDAVGKIDVLLIKEWEAKAKDKLHENVQKDVRRSLEKILQIEREQGRCDCEEKYVGFYVDIIQCTDARPNEAQNICSQLSDQLQEVCFQELLMFLERYNTEQTEALGKIAKTDKPETVHFLKTLKTCKELKHYVQTKGKDVKTSPLKETVETLENMEAFTLKLLMGIVADTMEDHFKKYFRSDNRQFLLSAAVRKHFPKLSFGLDEQKRVMDEAYQLIVRIYVKHLVQRSQSKLRKCWSPDVGQTVTDDAELLHSAISDLAPGVQEWNLVLLKAVEILECSSIDALKITAASMQELCLTKSEDAELLPALLRWKGLSKGEVTEVLDALPPDLQPSSSTSWYSCFLTCLR